MSTDYAPDQAYFSNEKKSKRLPIGVGLPKIPIADVTAGKLVSARKITNALADVRKNFKLYKDGIKPFQGQLLSTKAVDNTFAVVDRMCNALVTGDHRTSGDIEKNPGISETERYKYPDTTSRTDPKKSVSKTEPKNKAESEESWSSDSAGKESKLKKTMSAIRDSFMEHLRIVDKREVY